jgi:hypothetical protein
MVVRTVHDIGDRLNVERYMLFALRDAELVSAANENSPFCFFGITTAEYGRKPAFRCFPSLIHEFGIR